VLSIVAAAEADDRAVEWIQGMVRPHYFAEKRAIDAATMKHFEKIASKDWYMQMTSSLERPYDNNNIIDESINCQPSLMFVTFFCERALPVLRIVLFDANGIRNKAPPAIPHLLISDFDPQHKIRSQMRHKFLFVFATALSNRIQIASSLFTMGPPSLWMQFRQVIGRALRETGQALDRLGIRGKQVRCFRDSCHLPISFARCESFIYSHSLFLQHATTTRFNGDDPYIYDDHLSRHRNLMPLLRRGKPIVSPHVAYLAPNSTLIGSVRVGPGASVWYGAILRADACDNGSSFKRSDEQEMSNIWTLPKKRPHDTDHVPGGGIFIGENSNVQDGCLVTARESHTVIGNGVTIGHLAQIHSAKVDDHCLIGMGSVLLEGVVVETESFVGAGAVVQRGTVIPSGELWVGNPAHKVRSLTDKERAKLHFQADEVCTNTAFPSRT
jgi:carbonic anhydrase/acetyltransferase-like protein (isoleucine patch superfamily)